MIELTNLEEYKQKYSYYIVTDDKHYIWHYSSELYLDATIIYLGAGKEPRAYAMYKLCKDYKGLQKMLFNAGK